MQVADFHFELPESLIAKSPKKERSASRLMQLDGNSGEITHHQFSQIIDLAQPGDLLIFNNTRVIPARLFGQKSSGGKVEILVERLLDEHSVLAHVRANKAPKPGNIIYFDGGISAEMVKRHDDLFELEFEKSKPVLTLLETHGHMPLPPYIDRSDTEDDKSRYQTVYAEHSGAVAAPTAGLHFDQALMDDIKGKGASIGFVTLHVGAGTFQPVRADNIEDHHMHSEWLQVSAELCQQVTATKAKGGRVIAVGTTSVRCLETAAKAGDIAPFEGDTDIFIYPGYQFKVVDALLTNFHLSESTLLMLVSAFSGYHSIMAAYRAAVAERYRFFSYGDAMLLIHNPNAAQDIPGNE